MKGPLIEQHEIVGDLNWIVANYIRFELLLHRDVERASAIADALLAELERERKESSK